MKSIFLYLMSSICCILSCTNELHNQPSNKESELNGLSIKLVLPKTTFPTEEPIPAKIILTNLSQIPFNIIRRRQFGITIFAKKGKVEEFRPDGLMGGRYAGQKLRKDEFLLLKPGQFYKYSFEDILEDTSYAWWNLWPPYDLYLEEGIYELQAVYSNHLANSTHVEADVDFSILKPWQGEIKSQIVEITIVKDKNTSKTNEDKD